MKHEIGVILRDKRYSKLFEIIYKKTSKPRDIIPILEEYVPNLYGSKLSNYLGNINGKYYKFIKDNGQTKKDLIEYSIDYQGITKFLFDYFFSDYLKQVPLTEYIDYNDKEIKSKLKIYFDENFIKHKNKHNLFSLFRGFIIENYKFNNKRFMEYTIAIDKLTDKQKKIFSKKLDERMKFNVPRLSEEQHKQVLTPLFFDVLCDSYVHDLLTKSYQ